VAEEDFTVGVEEEYHLVDPVTRALRPMVDQVLPRAREVLGDDVQAELLQSQIEIGTPVSRTLDEVRAHLVHHRAAVRAAAEAEGVFIAACATHPFSRWEDQDVTGKEAYLALAERYGQLAFEQMVLGCHVHVGIGDRETAVQAMNHAGPWLAPLLALSASSPFWAGRDTGYASFRTEVFGRWPMTGTPSLVRDAAEYDRMVDELIRTDTVDAPGRLYFYLRPSAKFATLEFRIADVCTSLDDAVLMAGLTRGLARRCVDAALEGDPVPSVWPELLRSAAWRAARNGLDADLVDLQSLRSARPGRSSTASSPSCGPHSRSSGTGTRCATSSTPCSPGAPVRPGSASSFKRPARATRSWTGW
jgi:carboxylate-amine ligase